MTTRTLKMSDLFDSNAIALTSTCIFELEVTEALDLPTVGCPRFFDNFLKPRISNK